MLYSSINLFGGGYYGNFVWTCCESPVNPVDTEPSVPWWDVEIPRDLCERWQYEVWMWMISLVLWETLSLGRPVPCTDNNTSASIRPTLCNITCQTELATHMNMAIKQWKTCVDVDKFIWKEFFSTTFTKDNLSKNEVWFTCQLVSTYSQWKTYCRQFLRYYKIPLQIFVFPFPGYEKGAMWSVIQRSMFRSIPPVQNNGWLKWNFHLIASTFSVLSCLPRRTNSVNSVWRINFIVKINQSDVLFTSTQLIGSLMLVAENFTVFLMIGRF